MADSCQIDPGHTFHLPDEQCRELVGRIAASQEFHRAAKQREFLLYVVDRKLAGCPEDVTEALIGHRVYGRPASYDAGNDSIVRTEARTLRKRLERYFDGQGIDERVVIEIPRGGYLPVFRPRVEPSPPPVPAPPPQTSNLPSRRQWIWLGASAVTGAAVMFGWRNGPLFRTADGAPNRTPGIVQLESSDAELNVSFQRAKQRALSCVYTGDPVGEWYATRPDGGSNVFGMRNVAHQSTGASVLGLHRHTSNMLRCFARSVSRGRDWCGYWVITKDGFAAPSFVHLRQRFRLLPPGQFRYSAGLLRPVPLDRRHLVPGRGLPQLLRRHRDRLPADLGPGPRRHHGERPPPARSRLLLSAETQLPDRRGSGGRAICRIPHLRRDAGIDRARRQSLQTSGERVPRQGR